MNPPHAPRRKGLYLHTFFSDRINQLGGTRFTLVDLNPTSRREYFVS